MMGLLGMQDVKMTEEERDFAIRSHINGAFHTRDGSKCLDVRTFLEVEKRFEDELNRIRESMKDPSHRYDKHNPKYLPFLGAEKRFEEKPNRDHEFTRSFGCL